MQLKYSNYVAFSHFHGKAVNNSGIIKKFLKKWQVILIFTHIIIIFSVNFRRLIKIVFKSARKFTCVLIP